MYSPRLTKKQMKAFRGKYLVRASIFRAPLSLQKHLRFFRWSKKTRVCPGNDVGKSDCSDALKVREGQEITKGLTR